MNQDQIRHTSISINSLTFRWYQVKNSDLVQNENLKIDLSSSRHSQFAIRELEYAKPTQKLALDSLYLKKRGKEIKQVFSYLT